jgi:hypothetical protein
MDAKIDHYYFYGKNFLIIGRREGTIIIRGEAYSASTRRWRRALSRESEAESPEQSHGPGHGIFLDNVL